MEHNRLTEIKNYYIDILLNFKNVYLDYPFDNSDWAAIRHNDNKKIFALIYIRNEKVCINFKNEPMWGTFWRESFECVTPAYHMNKEHWSTVYIGEDVSEQQIIDMVTESYKLTESKRKKK